MKIPQDIKSIEIYYDGNCGMCNRFALWLEKQERALELTLMPYQEAIKEGHFPDIQTYHPEKELVCRTDTNTVFCGAEAWVMSLQSCNHFQGVAKHLSGKFMLPLAQSQLEQLKREHREEKGK